MRKKVHSKSSIAITTGDPASIGPEVVLKALVSYGNDFPFLPVVIGDYSFISAHYPGLVKKLDFNVVPSNFSGMSASSPNFVDIANAAAGTRIGAGSSETGKASLDYIDCSIDMWKSGIVTAVATAPVSKGFICESGTAFSGHTEYYAEKTGGDEPYMLMYSAKYRVILVTTHYPVISLGRLVTFEKILLTIRTADMAFSLIDRPHPAIAVCGFDPHCGDNGAIGTFDRDETSKAVAAARTDGINVSGPFAADTLFIPKRWSEYSCVVANYHDQGLVPFKMLAFEDGVNVTLGLPIVRTSADHGTAFDIAGKDTAGYASMRAAIDMACTLVPFKRKLS